MRSSHTILLLLAVCVLVAHARAGVQEVEVDELGQEVTFACSTSGRLADASLSHWVLSDFSELRVNNITSDGTTHYRLSDDGWRLHISSVKQSHLGDYFCVASRDNDGKMLFFKSSVSLASESTWESFETQTIVGCTATAVALFIFIGMFLVWHYRWRPDTPNIVADTDDNDNLSHIEKGFVNDSFVKSYPASSQSDVTVFTRM